MRRTLFSIYRLASFSIGAMAQMTNSPSTAVTPEADPAACNTLKSARETRHIIPTNFAVAMTDVIVNGDLSVSVNAKTGATNRSETSTDKYRLLDDVCFPAPHRPARAENDKGAII